jgi:hypothetical protein
MTVSSATRPLPLLTIDVDAEIARLTTGQILGSWQVPVELVRRAEGAGARRIEVALARGAMSVTDDGGPIPHAALEQLAHLAHELGTAEGRHAAATTLERNHPALLLLAGAWVSGATVESGDARLRLRRDGPASLESLSKTPSSPTRIRVHGSFERGRAAEALRGACRFTKALVLLDQRPLPRGFGEVIATGALKPPLAGRLALRDSGDGSGVWLLSQGVVTAHVTLAAAPPFDAALRLEGGRSAPASLRARLEPLVDELAQQAFALAREVAAQGADLPPLQQDRLARGLLSAARQQRALGAIMGLPIIPALREGRHLRLSLGELTRHRGRWPAILPHEDPTDLLPTSTPVLVLGTELRTALAGLMRMQFDLPPRRPQRPGVSEMASSLADSLRGLIASGMRLAWARIVPEARLDPAERALRRALAAALQGDGIVDDVVLCEGRSAPHIAGRLLRLGRRHRDVAAAAARLARDPDWAYPALLALAPRIGTAATPFRRAWLTGESPPAIVTPRR